jgi:uncharacterized membrane protein YhhN
VVDRVTLRWFVGYGVVTAVHLGALAAGADRLADLTQVLLMPVLAGALVVWVRRRRPLGRLIGATLAALGFSWLGDSVPRLLDGDPAFLAMVGFFLCAQVSYLVGFWPFAPDSVLQRRRGWLLAYAVVVLALIGACLPGAGMLAGPVVGYGLCLGTMAVIATGVDRLAWIGGALFLISDGLIALQAFTDLELPAHDVVVMSTYTAAQLLLVLGVMRRVAGGAVPDGDLAARSST